MHIEELKDMLCEELDKIAKKGELSAGSLDAVQKLTHSIKNIDTIMAMEGYSNDNSYDDYDRSYNGSYDGSYARGRSGRMNRNSYARGGRGRTRGYSRDDKEEMVEKLEDMMQEAQDPSVKEALKKALHMMN